MSDLSERVASLSPEKLALLQARLKKQVDASQRVRIAHRTEFGPPPLSFAQERLWFLDRLQPNNPVYNMPISIRFPGPINSAALERSINEIVRRHETLRTVFKIVDNKPVQIIEPSRTLELDVEDLSHVSGYQQQVQAQELAGIEAQQPFDLSRPLLRCRLLRFSPSDHILLLTLHHIISDGWSLDVLLRELSMLYEAYCSGKQSPLEELPVQYADYARWQREYLQGDVLQQHLSYWKQKMEGAPAVLEMPTDRPRPAMQSFRGAIQAFDIDKHTSMVLKQLSRQEGTTLFMTLLAVFKVLLYRYSGQEDIVVGTPIAGRNHKELEGLIGFFVNTLVLRTDLGGGPSFRELLKRVREVTLGAYAHQELPFEKLVEEIQPQRDMSRNPLFQVVFILQNTPGLNQRSASGEEEPSNGEHSGNATFGTAKFDLTMSLMETAQVLRGVVEYNTDLFEAETINRMIGHMKTLLASVVKDPDQRISHLQMLTTMEARQLLEEWNDTRTGSQENECVHELFERQVERDPEAMAIDSHQQNVSYGELNRRANQLGRYLRALGVGPEVRVGICLERSVEMVVGLLGILKAGGAYVPLDPSYPKERLEFMIEDSQAPVLLTQEKLAEVVAEVQGLRIIKLDSEWGEIACEGEENFGSGVTPDNAAYVIYTSGSTGRNKGVLIQHRGVCNTLGVQVRSLRIRPDDRVLQVASLSFDLSMYEMGMALLGGATLCLIPQDTLVFGTSLSAILRDQHITVLTLPPSVLASLSLEVFPGLRLITVAGEACSADLVARWAEHYQIFNAYGPTETTMWVAGAYIDGSRKPPIGRPIDNTQIYLLDNNLEPRPIGVPCELCVGGIGLARGYVNLPSSTAEKFIPNPFSQEPGARLYRTGDVARYLPDGNIEYLGRIDHQVKIRGYRIELGEIEAVLSQHQQITDAVAVVSVDSRGEKRLAAYVVADHSITTSELKSYLKQRLPEYMIPHYIVRLDQLPLTPNGKLDRRALPEPEAAREQAGEGYIAPGNAVEEVLARIWSEVLGIKVVGINDNFFQLGGHSLLATQFVSRVREAFGLELPLAEVFEKPSIAELALAIAQLQAEQGIGNCKTIDKVSPANADQLLESIESLSEDQVDLLLKSMLDDKVGP